MDARTGILAEGAILDQIVAVPRADGDTGLMIVPKRATSHGDVIGPDAKKEAIRAVAITAALFKKHVCAARPRMQTVARVVTEGAVADQHLRTQLETQAFPIELRLCNVGDFNFVTMVEVNRAIATPVNHLGIIGQIAVQRQISYGGSTDGPSKYQWIICDQLWLVLGAVIRLDATVQSHPISLNPSDACKRCIEPPLLFVEDRHRHAHGQTSSVDKGHIPHAIIMITTEGIGSPSSLAQDGARSAAPQFDPGMQLQSPVQGQIKFGQLHYTAGNPQLIKCSLNTLGITTFISV